VVTGTPYNAKKFIDKLVYNKVKYRWVCGRFSGRAKYEDGRIIEAT
jgi:hypothetical protein